MLHRNKYVETLLLVSFTCLFSYKLNAHIKVPTHKCNNIFSLVFARIVFVPKSLHNEFVLFILLSYVSSPIKTSEISLEIFNVRSNVRR